MGITHFEANLIREVIAANPSIKSVVSYGSQNLYLNGEQNPPFCDHFFKELGIENYKQIDLAGDNNAIVADLSRPIEITEKFDLLVDSGTKEHICQMKSYHSVAFHDGHINSIYPTEVENADAGFYHAWLNAHNLLKVGGIMININPKTGHWPGHGYHYITGFFYENIARCSDYEILGMGEDACMGNSVDGVNVWCVMKKHSEVFPTEEMFGLFDYYKS